MASEGARSIATSRVGLSAALLGVAVELFALSTNLPWDVALVVGGTGISAAIGLRTFSSGRRTDAAALLVLFVMAILAIAAPDTEFSGLTAGLAVLALLLWLADEPGRVSSGMRRALPAAGVVALAFGVAWVAAFLLPATQVPAGVIGGLLVAVVLLATALLARPEMLEEEPALSTA